DVPEYPVPAHSAASFTPRGRGDRRPHAPHEEPPPDRRPHAPHEEPPPDRRPHAPREEPLHAEREAYVHGRLRPFLNCLICGGWLAYPSVGRAETGPVEPNPWRPWPSQLSPRRLHGHHTRLPVREAPPGRGGAGRYQGPVPGLWDRGQGPPVGH